VPADPSCATYCEHARALPDCGLGDPSPGGASCEDVCDNQLRFGYSLDLACMSTAPTCAAISEC